MLDETLLPYSIFLNRLPHFFALFLTVTWLPDKVTRLKFIIPYTISTKVNTVIVNLILKFANYRRTFF